MLPLSPETFEVFIHLFRLMAGPLTPGGIEAAVTQTRPTFRFAQGVYPLGLTHTQLLRVGERATHDVGLLTPFATTDISGLVPLNATPEYIQKIARAAQLPEWVGKVFQYTGLITLILGMIGWVLSPSEQNRQRGFQMVSSGFVLTIIGFGFAAFQSLLAYVLTG